MPKKLILICEGKSDKQTLIGSSNNAKRKATRPLSDKGKRLAQRLGIWLLRQNLILDEVLSSTSERAMTSSEKMLKAMNLGANRIRSTQTLANLRPKQQLKMIKELPDSANNVAVVGNKKQLSALLKTLSKAPHEPLKASSLIVLSGPKKWKKAAPKRFETCAQTNKKLLPKGFPYPHLSSQETRIRPAYYYQQSAVLPYRIKKDQIQLLLITSSKNNHWVIPKGIHEPGLSAQESAAKEAFEEAGIEGKVEACLLGQYEITKWQGQCTVKVYPMQVLHQLSNARWPESHRQRKWMSLDEAKSCLNNPQLEPIIEQLQEYLRS
ncbi:NUDIX domain-containing protein [Gayadomonas joobiniege]|uniref:NUDIX domain-containing protein n=1 Tax=Gayadomonas joobiniege TaxID=1234606 RepID=UPI00035D0B7A|nr:NUDIX domain-containing protein [Gayadomonas joobiniege]